MLKRVSHIIHLMALRSHSKPGAPICVLASGENSNVGRLSRGRRGRLGPGEEPGKVGGPDQFDRR